MKQRGRNRPFWDKGGGRPGERAAREQQGERPARETKGERAPRETPGERAARAFDERDVGRAERDAGRKPPRARPDAKDSDEQRRRPADSRRQREDRRPPRDDTRPQTSEPHRHGERRQRDDARPRREEPRPRQELRPRDEPRHREESRRREAPRLHEEPRRLDEWRGREAGRAARADSEGALLFGVQPVLEALRAGQRPLERLTVVEGAHEARVYEILALARAAQVPVRRAPRAELHRLAAGANHQGVVATIAAARYAPAAELLDALAARVGTDDPPLALVLDGVADPRNLGAILRTAECAGAHGLFVPERRAAGLTETVAKAAAGALEYVPVARAANLARLVDELKERSVWTVGTAADAEVNYTDWDWTQPCALVLGGEGEGLRRLVRERCDVLVRIPLRGRIPSLNVSVAAGVLLYEALRQRTAGRGNT
jgi:23S rRNA (guanosine2251-2'-O)-methyltransferase